MGYTLAIGDRSYSSWSLRGWLMFAKFDLDVTVRSAPMYTRAFDRMLADFGAALLVPALRVDDAGAGFVLWDTLAIAETLAERHPDRGFWPEAPAARALARSMAAEMYAGFTALRGACPMNLRRAYAGFAPEPGVCADLARIETLWAAAFAMGGEGGWLFGRYSLADVFFAPVAARVAGYDLPLGQAGRAYVTRHLADQAFVAWRAAGLVEPQAQPGYDLDLPERPWPGPA